MTDTVIEHIDHPECPDSFNTKTKFDEAVTIERIQNNVECVYSSPELANYKPFIEIFDTKEGKYILLNEEYLNSTRPFHTQNASLTQNIAPLGLADGVRQSVQLRVKWKPKKRPDEVSTALVSSGNVTTYNNKVLYNNQETQSPVHIAPYTSTQQNIDSTENIVKRPLYQRNTTNEPLHFEEESVFLNDFECSLSDDTISEISQQQTVSGKVDRNVFDLYLNIPSTGNNQGNAIDSLSISNRQSDTEATQFGDTINLLDNVLYSQSVSSNDVHSLSTAANCLVANNNTNHQKQMVPPRKKKKTENIIIIPKTIRSIQFPSDLSSTPREVLYNSTNLPLVSGFDPLKAIEFLLNVGTCHRVQFLSDRDPVKSCSASGRSIICLQGNKKNAINKRDPLLPKLKIPGDYQKLINDGGSVTMCVSCVKEYFITETGEIGYCIVGNKKFLEDVNTEHEKQVEQIFIQLTNENTDAGQYELAVAIFKVVHVIGNEIGPALFKLSKQYIETAQANGLEFGHGDPSHRLAVFILKTPSGANEAKPDWETLVLSDYIHQRKNDNDPASQ